MVLVSAIALLLALGLPGGSGHVSVCALNAGARPAQTMGDAATLDCERLIEVDVARAAVASDADTWWLEMQIGRRSRSALQAFLEARQRSLVAYIASGRQLGVAMVMGSDPAVMRLGFDSEADARRVLDWVCAGRPEACAP